MEQTFSRVSSRSYRAPRPISGPLAALVAAVLVLAPFDPARAGQISLGTRGGVANVLVVDPTTSGVVYAGTGDGVFVSRDAGATWRLENDGIRGSVLHLIADPERAGTLYAGTSEGLFKSTDGASSWTKLETGSGSVLDLVMDPQDRDVLYVSQYRGGILRTADGGRSWSQLGADLDRSTLAALAVDPREPGTLYAASAGSYSPRSTSSLYKSTDRGAHWHLLASQPDDVLIHSIRIDPAPPGRLYLTTSGGMFRSSQEAGSSWQGPLRHGPERPSVEFLEIDSGVLYAGTLEHGLFGSSHQGRVLEPIRGGLEGLQLFSFAADPRTPGLFYVATTTGVFRTTAESAHWTPTGFPHAIVRALAIDPTQPSTLYAAAGRRGGYKTTDGGATWQSLGFSVVRNLVAVSSVAVSSGAVSSGTVYLTTNDDLFLSRDGGDSWTRVQGIDAEYLGALVADPRAGDLYVETRDGWFLVEDGADTATPALPELSDDDVFDLKFGDDGSRYAVVYGSGVLRTSGPDVPWQPTRLDFLPRVLAVAGRNGETAYFGGSEGSFYKTDDGGGSWIELGEDVLTSRATSLVLDPQDSDVLYLGTYDGLFKSTDGGAEWRRLRSGLSVSILSLVAHPTEGGGVYAGTYGAGVFKTTDGGESWRALGPATSFAFDR